MEKYIIEDYCSEEITGLLLNKGYIGSTNTYLDKDGFMVKEITIQSAMKWLREVHGLDIDISIEYTPKKVYYYSILKKTVIRNIDCPHSETNFKYYEEAAEAAIIFCLENLI